MKKLPMILLLAGPYALLIGILFSSESGIFLKAGGIIYIMLLLFNMIYAFLLPRLGFDEKQIIYQYNDEEWSYLCDSNSMLPAMWEPHSNGWSGSKFANIEDLMK